MAEPVEELPGDPVERRIGDQPIVAAPPCSTVETGVMPPPVTIAVFMKVAGCRQVTVTWAASSSSARSKVNAASASFALR